MMFQSTHSLRSATDAGETLTWAIYVSIHALLAECDVRLWLISRFLYSFNPRTPCGVRLDLNCKCKCSMWFQSTHSLRSATHDRRLGDVDYLVSIHALLAECDGQPPDNKRNTKSFNPRTPCGVRLNCKCKCKCSMWFQSTHSLRSATRNTPAVTSPFNVSIHALLAECDATDFIHYYSTEQIILCANLPKKTVIARLHFLSIYLSIFYSQCITPIADLPGNSCELEVGAQAMFHSL